MSGAVLICLLLLLPCFKAQDLSELTSPAKSTASDIMFFPISMLYLIQPENLAAALPGEALAAMVLKHPDNAIVAEKCLLAASETPEKREIFLRSLENATNLSSRVQREVAAYMVQWFPDLDTDWKFERFYLALCTGSPLIAYLPREFLYALTGSAQIKFLYHLQAWKWSSPREAEWQSKPRALQRSWAEMMMRAQFPVPLSQFSAHDFSRQGFLLPGATPDELSQLVLDEPESKAYMKTVNFDAMQTRAIFNATFRHRTTRQRPAVALGVHMLPFLTPNQIKSLHYARVNLSELGTIRYSRQVTRASATQLAYCLSAQASGTDSAHDQIKSRALRELAYVANWVYALPQSHLLRLASQVEASWTSAIIEPQEMRILRALGASPLTALQSRQLLSTQFHRRDLHHFVTQSLLMTMQGSLLMALPASRLAASHLSQIPQRLLVHLATSLPPNSLATFSLYLKLLPIINQEWALEAVMERSTPAIFLDLLPFSEIQLIVSQLRSALARHPQAGAQLSRCTLRLIVGHWRRVSSRWQDGLLQVPSLLPGLRCSDLEDLETGNVLPVLAALGNFIRDNNLPYPEDLQHCGLHVLRSYLATRAHLRKQSDQQILDTMDAAEIEAVGGYILGRVPITTLSETSQLHVIRAVGRLPMSQIVHVFRHETTPFRLASGALRAESPPLGLATLELLGNLVQFLPVPQYVARHLQPRAFRLWLEGLQDTSLCVTRSARDAFWFKMISNSYGPPWSWSAGTLGTLRGFLLTVPPHLLDQIPAASWLDTVDYLNLHMGYSQEFMQACNRHLGSDESYEMRTALVGLMRRLLDASQALQLSVTPGCLKQPKSAVHVPESRLQIANVIESVPEPTSSGYQVSCSALKMAPLAATLSLNETELLALAEAKELDAECVEFLGSLELSALLVTQIWNIIRTRNITVEAHDLGHLASQIDATLASRWDLTDLDTVIALGRNVYNWQNMPQLAQLVLAAHNVSLERPLSDELAGAMGSLLCGLFSDSLSTKYLLSPHCFLKISGLLSKTLGGFPVCPPLSCTRGLMDLATAQGAYGPVSFWSSEVLTSLGVIATVNTYMTVQAVARFFTGLSPKELNSLPRHALYGLTAEATQCMPVKTLNALSVGQMSSLSLSALNAITQAQWTQIPIHLQDTIRSSRAPPVFTAAEWEPGSRAALDGQYNGASTLPTLSDFALWLYIATLIIIIRFGNAISELELMSDASRSRTGSSVSIKGKTKTVTSSQYDVIIRLEYRDEFSSPKLA